METPESNPGKTPPYDTRRGWRRFNVVVIVLMIILAIAFAYVYGRQSAPSTPVAKTNPTPSPRQSPTSTTQTLTEPVRIFKSGEPGPQAAADYNLTIKAPSAWRAVELRSADLTGWGDFDGRDLLALLRFVPENAGYSTIYSSLEPTNRLDVLNVTSWLTQTSDNLLTPKQKQAYISYLEGVKSLSDLKNKTGCQPIVIDSGGLCGDPEIMPQIISTADGSLKGVAYLSMGHQAVFYGPQAQVYLVGNINGQTVYAEGLFSIYDQTYHQLEGVSNPDGKQVAAAMDRFLAGVVPSDTQVLYQHITDAIKSIRIAPVMSAKP